MRLPRSHRVTGPLLGLACLTLGGCGGGGPTGPAAAGADPETTAMAQRLGMAPAELAAKKAMLKDQGLGPGEIEKALQMGGGAASLFLDDAQSNRAPPESIGDLIFFAGEQDREVKVASLIGEGNLVLVFTRGYFGGSVCPFCVAQTAELSAQREALRERNAKVLIIYPGSGEHLPEFIDAVDTLRDEGAAGAWPVVLDRDLSAVNQLEIAADLAMPSTFVLDRSGRVRFAYVGANRTDRPSVAAILAQLDALAP